MLYLALCMQRIVGTLSAVKQVLNAVTQVHQRNLALCLFNVINLRALMVLCRLMQFIDDEFNCIQNLLTVHNLWNVWKRCVVKMHKYNKDFMSIR